MSNITCDNEECIHNTDSVCGQQESISISEYLEVNCACEGAHGYHCSDSGLPISECDCEGGCKIDPKEVK